MNCKQARRLMQDILDGTQADNAELDGHCAECPQCRAEWGQLQALDSAVRTDVRCDVPVERRDRVIAAALHRLEFQQGHTVRDVRWPRWVAAAALVIVAFSVGLGAGRTVWPRELIVKVTEVHEKIVEVEVPVIKERVVVKHVPVYKTRIVYRHREVPEATPVAERQREPVKCDEILVYLPSIPIAATARVTEEVQPAEVLDAGESDETPATQGHWQTPAATTTASAGTEMVIVQNLSD